MKININNFEKILKVKFKNKALLIDSLTHKSANQKKNNEKLEFLGDRVIGLILSKKLYDLYPQENEGVLDKRFARLVNRKTCSEIALSISIQNYILLGNKKKIITDKDEKILSDACEGLIGAIFIDKGYNFTKEFILRIWRKHIDKSNITTLDSKTKLQEYSLKKFKKLPRYSLVNSSGQKHNPIYKISVTILNSKMFIGEGSSKKNAEQNAAEKLLKAEKIN